MPSLRLTNPPERPDDKRKHGNVCDSGQDKQPRGPQGSGHGGAKAALRRTPRLHHRMLLHEPRTPGIEPRSGGAHSRHALRVRRPRRQDSLRRRPPGLRPQDTHRPQGGLQDPAHRRRPERLPQEERKRVRLLRRRTLLHLHLGGPRLRLRLEDDGVGREGDSPDRRRRDDGRTRFRRAQQRRRRQRRPAGHPERQQPVHRRQHRRDARAPAEALDQHLLQQFQGIRMDRPRRGQVQALPAAVDTQPEVVDSQAHRRRRVRVAGIQVFRPGRRQQHRGGGQSAEAPQGHQGPAHTPLHDRQGQGLPRRREGPDHVARPREVQPADSREDQ